MTTGAISAPVQCALHIANFLAYALHIAIDKHPVKG